MYQVEDEATRRAMERITEAAQKASSTLDLSGLGLTVLPEAIGQLSTLTHLDLYGNPLTVLPEAIGQLTALTDLNLFGNRLTVLPEAIGQLTALTYLNLSGNRFSALPEAIGQLTALTYLDLSGNRLTALPEAIGQLTALTYLNLSGNELTAVPVEVGQLTALTHLDLFGNPLTVLPEAIGRLTALIYLDLGGNRLTVLPEAIGQLTALTFLDLSGNRLIALPAIGQLTALTVLDLVGNASLISPPPEVVAQGVQAVLAFLRARAEASTRQWQSKILIVGEATVGKTSLAKQLRGEPFDPDEGQTHGVRVHALPLPHPAEPEIEMALDLWDFGGQLEYRATQRFYLTDRSLFLLVWNSRARAVDGKVLAWLDAITARAPHSPILIVATNGDESSPATLPADLTSRYPRIAAVHTVDSRTGRGIAELRQAIADQAAELRLMGMSWPTTWAAAAQAVRDLPGLTATRNAVFKAMAAAEVTDPAGQQAIAGILHDLGQIAYFADQPDLAAKVILKPQWLDARITQVIDSPEVAATGGVLSRAERQRLWGDLADDEDDPDLPDRLVRMMEAFDLAYRVGDALDSTDVALIVDRLPDARPAAADQEWERQAAAAGMREIGITYKLASRQAGIPTWFIAREHRYTTGLHWKGGALLHDRDPDTPAWALLEDDGREQPTITLRAIGTYPVRFLSVLAEAFDNIIEDRYPGLVEHRLIPCACQDGAQQRCGHAFTLDELLAEATATEPDADHKVRCPRSRIKIDAAVMLDGLRGTGLVAELDALHRQITAQGTTLIRIDALHRQITAQGTTLNRIDAGQQAMLNGIRTLLEHRANAGEHCPALFSIEAAGRTRLLRREQLTLTLWCEWPSGPHALTGEDGRYPIAKIPPTLISYLPYLRFLINALGLVTPGLTTAGFTLNERVKSGIEAATKTLEYIDKHISLDRTDWTLDPDRLVPVPGALIRARSGADFRALRDMLHALDPDNKKNWGGLSPVSRPEDRRMLYLCPEHLPELDYPYMAAASAP